MKVLRLVHRLRFHTNFLFILIYQVIEDKCLSAMQCYAVSNIFNLNDCFRFQKLHDTKSTRYIKIYNFRQENQGRLFYFSSWNGLSSFSFDKFLIINFITIPGFCKIPVNEIENCL